MRYPSSTRTFENSAITPGLEDPSRSSNEYEVRMNGRDIYLSKLHSLLERRDKIWTAIWQSSFAACSMLANASVYILIAHMLGPQSFGTYMFVRWLAIIAVPIMGTGMSTLTSRQIADIQSREAPRFVAGIFYFLWYRQCCCILLYILAYLTLSIPISRFFGFFSPVILLLSSLSTLPLLISSVAGLTLRSLRRVDLLATLHLFSALTSLLSMIIVWQVGSRQVGTFLLASTLADTLTLALAAICVIRLLPMKEAQQPGIFLRERLKRALKHPFTPFILDVIVWQRSELPLLALWHQPAELGFYIISSMISSAVIGIAPTLFSTYVQPLLLRYMPTRHYHNPYDAFIKTSCYIVFLAIPICFLFIVFCPAIITFCLGRAYFPAIIPLRILLIASVFGSIATISVTCLANNGQQSSRVWPGIGVALLKIVLAWVCIAHWGMIGAAFASASAQIVSAISSICICRNLLIRYEIGIQNS